MREVRAAKVATPVYLDAWQGTGPGQGEPDWTGDLADPAVDVESQAAVNGILGAALSASRELPVEQQALLMYRYHRGLSLEDIAEALGTSLDRVRALHQAAVCRVHDAMLAAASG